MYSSVLDPTRWSSLPRVIARRGEPADSDEVNSGSPLRADLRRETPLRLFRGEESQPLRFGTAAMAAFVGLFVSSVPLRVVRAIPDDLTPVPSGKWYALYALGILLGAFMGSPVLVWILSRFRYDIPYGNGVVALLVGQGVGALGWLAALHLFPGSIAGLAANALGVGLSAWIVRRCATPAFRSPRLRMADIGPTLPRRDYSGLLRRTQQAVTDFEYSLARCPITDLPTRVSETLAVLTQLAEALDSAVPSDPRAEAPQRLLARGLRGLQDDLVALVERAEARGEGDEGDSLDLPDRLADLEDGAGLPTIRQALELLRGLGFAVQPESV